MKNILSSLKNSLELNQVEIGPLLAPVTINFYEKWLAKNYHGNMNYLNTHLPLKKNPQLLPNPTGKKLNSVISISQSYFPAVQKSQVSTPARVAMYAQNEDYHHWLKQKLLIIIKDLQLKFPDETFLPYVDSGPILERELAYKNKLGWFGKNSCLIHPLHGSLFFIAEILTSYSSTETEFISEPLPDFCGTCQKCIDICPTGALIAPKTLKADDCISYLTIESKSTPPIQLRKKIGDWFFGCDLCQTVCPWNEKVFRTKKIKPSGLTSTNTLLELSHHERTELINYFKFLLTASHKQIQKFHFGSALSRAGAKGLKRNALIVIANQNIFELKEFIKSDIDELTELTEWTLSQLS